MHGFNVSFRHSYPRSTFCLLTNLDKIHWNHRPGVSSHKVDGTEERDFSDWNRLDTAVGISLQAREAKWPHVYELTS